jgi:hypothetical protein
MIDLDSQEVLHWINVYAVIFSILILSLSINFTSNIKNIVNRILLIIALTGIIRFLMNWFLFSEVYIGYTQQEFLPYFIYQGFDRNLFSGIIPLILSILSAIFLIIRLVIFHYKNKK